MIFLIFGVHFIYNCIYPHLLALGQKYLQNVPKKNSDFTMFLIGNKIKKSPSNTFTFVHKIKTCKTDLLMLINHYLVRNEVLWTE